MDILNADTPTRTDTEEPACKEAQSEDACTPGPRSMEHSCVQNVMKFLWLEIRIWRHGYFPLYARDRYAWNRYVQFHSIKPPCLTLRLHIVLPDLQDDAKIKRIQPALPDLL